MLRELVAASGVKQRTLESYMSGRVTPVSENFIRLARVLPLSYANDVLARAGLGHVCPLEVPEDAKDARRAMAEMAIAMNKLADALLDGVIDHREALELAPQFKEMGANMMTFGRGLAPDS